MTIKQQIKYHLDNKKYCKVKRLVGDNYFEYSNGYLVDSSARFLLMQEADDFRVEGYLVFPISTVTQIRYNIYDRYYDKIMRWEKQNGKVFKKYDIDLTDWSTIFKTIKKAGFNVIVENEDRIDNSFDIEPIIKTTRAAVFIQYFNPRGFLEIKPTKITFDKITIAEFDANYVNVFSKYLRGRKSK